MAVLAEDHVETPVSDPILYVGTYSVRSSGGVYSYRLDTLSGKLTPLAVTATAVHPSSLIASPKGNRLYVASETGSREEGKHGSIACYRFNRSNGELHLLNRVESGGAGPCYMSLEEEGRYLMAANFHGGTIAVLPIGDEGALHPPSMVVGCDSLIKPRPHAVSCPHFIHMAPGNRFVIIADLGLDQLTIFPVQGGVNPLARGRQMVLTLREHSGPRYGCFHPGGLWFYLLNELSSEIVVYSWDPHAGSLTAVQSLSSFPPEYTRNNFAAEVHVDAAGQYLYASNRGHDSIAIFRIDRHLGTLTFLSCTSSAGKAPRSFALHPTGRYLVVGNEESDALVVFSISHRNGNSYLSSIVDTCKVPSPACLTFV
jgi:6-phosphogluconolactonase